MIFLIVTVYQDGVYAVEVAYDPRHQYFQLMFMESVSKLCT
jgi:hypothetical protein